MRTQELRIGTKMRGIILRVRDILLAFTVLSALLPVWAEGFPGIGDRLLYADALPHYNLGNKYLASRWYEKAVEKYNEAIDIYPHDADVYANLSVALRKLDDLQGAENALRKAIELNDKDWVTLSNLANMLMLQERFSESLKFFELALKAEGIPETDKKTIHYNIFGIRKIMKNKGLDPDNRDEGANFDNRTQSKEPSVRPKNTSLPTKKNISEKSKSTINDTKTDTDGGSGYESWLDSSGE